ncbi:MAG: BNR repeat-containing protein [Pyrinomonadaceae bacterium]
MIVRLQINCLIVASLFMAWGVSAQVRVVPLAEGWAQNQVNSVVFRKNSVTSYKDHQFAAFYDPESRVVLAKRRLGSSNWEIRRTQFTGNTADAHNSISIAVDGSGFLHLSWDQHNTALKYARSVSAGSLVMSEKTVMIGETEKSVTYPEFYPLPSGDLLFFYRDGASGNGNLVLNRYDITSKKWSRIQTSLIDGERKRNAYPQIAVDTQGVIHVSWVWRESPDVASNHDFCYARSRDGGRTWERSNGEQYQLPITAATAEYALRIPQNSELINQASMTADRYGNPYIATYWRDANSMVPQYRVVYLKNGKWDMAQVSNRITPFTLSGAGTKRIPISRPQIVVDSKGNKTKAIVIFRDTERNSRVSALIAEDIGKTDWKTIDLDPADVGSWEPTFDQNLWNRKKTLSLFVQKVGQGDGEGLEQLPPQPISILEWKP